MEETKNVLLCKIEHMKFFKGEHPNDPVKKRGGFYRRTI